MEDVKSIGEKAVATQKLSEAQIIRLLDDPATATALYRAADQVRKQNVGDCVHLRGLIEFSNICCRDCHYCGLRSANAEIKRYRLQPDAIVKLAEQGRR